MSHPCLQLISTTPSDTPFSSPLSSSAAGPERNTYIFRRLGCPPPAFFLWVPGFTNHEAPILLLNRALVVHLAKTTAWAGTQLSSVLPYLLPRETRLFFRPCWLGPPPFWRRCMHWIRKRTRLSLRSSLSAPLRSTRPPPPPPLPRAPGRHLVKGEIFLQDTRDEDRCGLVEARTRPAPVQAFVDAPTCQRCWLICSVYVHTRRSFVVGHRSISGLLVPIDDGMRERQRRPSPTKSLWHYFCGSATSRPSGMVCATLLFPASDACNFLRVFSSGRTAPYIFFCCPSTFPALQRACPADYAGGARRGRRESEPVEGHRCAARHGAGARGHAAAVRDQVGTGGKKKKKNSRQAASRAALSRYSAKVKLRSHTRVEAHLPPATMLVFSGREDRGVVVGVLNSRENAEKGDFGHKPVASPRGNFVVPR